MTLAIHLAVNARASYFRTMKRLFAFLIAWGVIATAINAQNVPAVADRQVVEERLQQLAGRLQDLQEAQQAQARRLEALAAEIRAVREDFSKPDTDKVQRDELRKLAEQLRDVDEKRAADKELILKEITKLANVPISAKSQQSRPSKADEAAGDASNDKNYEGYEHAVQSGETLMAIIQAYNKEYGLKLTLSQVVKHPLNAKLNPDVLRVGQKVFIPAK